MSATGGLLFLRSFSDHRFGGDHQARDRGGVLQCSTRDLGRVQDAHGDHVAVFTGRGVVAVAAGALLGLLLDALEGPVAYTPVEISRSALLDSVERLDREFDEVEMLPVCRDFTEPLPLPRPSREAQRVLVFSRAQPWATSLTPRACT